MSRQEDLTYRWKHPVLNEEWKLGAACRDEDPALFFPILGRHRGEYNQQVLEAQMVCLRCPVIGECLQYALKTDTQHGIWGGATEVDRARLKGRKRVY